MSLLMHLIAVEIAEKVAKEINIRNIFRRRPEDAMDVIRKAKDVLGSFRVSFGGREKASHNSKITSSTFVII